MRGLDDADLRLLSLPTEHQSAENLVVIREDEPTSIVAFTLAYAPPLGRDWSIG